MMNSFPMRRVPCVSEYTLCVCVCSYSCDMLLGADVNSITGFLESSVTEC